MRESLQKRGTFEKLRQKNNNNKLRWAGAIVGEEGQQAALDGTEREALNFRHPEGSTERVPSTPKACFCLMLAYHYRWPDKTEEGRKLSRARR